MASILTCSANQSIRAERNSNPLSDEQIVKISIGHDTVSHMSREEAAQLAAELLNAAGVEPAATEVAA